VIITGDPELLPPEHDPQVEITALGVDEVPFGQREEVAL
jgi:hypothetical protein